MFPAEGLAPATGYAALPRALAAGLGAIALLVLPGRQLEAACGTTFGALSGDDDKAPVESGMAKFARAFAASVGMIAVAGGLASVTGGSAVHASALVLLATVVCTAAASRRSLRAVADTTSSAAPNPAYTSSEPIRQLGTGIMPQACALLCLIALALAAMATPNASLDRMWYTAFVTRLADTQPLSWSEPFFGTGQTPPRFAWNPWLAAMACWSRLIGAPPGYVFQTAAPVLLAPLVLCAHTALARGLRGPGLGIWPGISASLLLACGTWPFFSERTGLLFARIAEDKSVALLVLLPVGLSLMLRRRESRDTDSSRAFKSAPNAATDAATDADPDSGGTGIGTGQQSGGLPVVSMVLLGTALSHGIAYLLLLIAAASTATLAKLSDLRRSTGDWNDENENVDGNVSGVGLLPRAAILALLLALIPAVLGLQASSSLVPGAPGDDLLAAQSRHPVVRAHVRLNRLLELPAGGPIVHPRLLLDAATLAALPGLALACVRANSAWRIYLVGSALAGMTLAFLPVASPLFGRLVLPWMSYRALWLLPAGFGLFESLRQLGRFGPVGRTLAGAVALALLAHGGDATRLPGQTDFARESLLAAHPELAVVLQEVRRLPEGSVLAASREMSELIAAYTQHSVVAASARATHVFARNSEEAERRLRNAALLTGLLPGIEASMPEEAERWRVHALVESGATHVLLEAAECARPARPVFRGHGMTLCSMAGVTAASRPLLAQPLFAVPTERLDNDATSGSRNVQHPGLAPGVACTPDPLTARESPAEAAEAGKAGKVGRSATATWRRPWRWSGRGLVVRCDARLQEPGHSAAVSRKMEPGDTPVSEGDHTGSGWIIQAELPHAREELLFAVEASSGTQRRVGMGSVWLEGRQIVRIPLPLLGAETARIYLQPAQLPYLNLRRLALENAASF